MRGLRIGSSLLAAFLMGACAMAPAGLAPEAPEAPDVHGGFRLAGRSGGPGPIFLSGSGDETPRLIQAFRDLAGGPAARIVIGPFAGGAASALATRAKFRDAQVARAEALSGEAEDLAADLAAIRAADGIFFVGGLAEAASRRMGPYAEALREAWQGGAVVGGNSAGAMLWGDRLIVKGDARGALAKGVAADAGGLDLRAGLGLLPGAIVDPHFTERGRFTRLWVAAGATGRLGIGVDENTAAIVEPAGTLRVVGGGGVTVIRPPGGAGGDDGAARVTVLDEGRTIDLEEWKPTP